MSCIVETMPHIRRRVMSYQECMQCCLYSGCEDTDSGCDVSCIAYMLPYILDVVSYIEVVMSYVQKSDDIMIGYDVFIGHRMSHRRWV